MSKIIGLGVDIVFIPRITGLVSRFESKFLERAFHPKEIEDFKQLTDINAKKWNWLASRQVPFLSLS
jgi:holo-[acyl-carrier protein] synthase